MRAPRTYREAGVDVAEAERAVERIGRAANVHCTSGDGSSCAPRPVYVVTPGGVVSRRSGHA